MPPIKSAQQIAEKYGRVTPARAEDYRLGVQTPRVDWATASAGSENTWRDAVTAAAGRGAYASGVRGAGSQKWQSRTLAKGPSRYAEGVSLGQADYEQGIAPYRDTIERTNLPPRGPKGDPRNLERVRVIANALRQRKVQTSGGTAR
jgi:hypothetical protein